MGKGGGKSSARSGGGGGSKPKPSEPVKGSASNPVTAGQLDKMSQPERVDALNAMPVGTIVARRITAGDKPTRYKKDASGQWSKEISYRTASRGKLVERKEWLPADYSSSNLAKFAYSSGSFDSVRYPKK